MTTIEPVRSSRDLEQFIRMPWDLYRGDKNWIPPLIAAERKMLDRRRNPFWRHAEAEHFLARRNGAIVGRISAIVNHAHNSTHNEKAGWFGFFESEQDPATAKELLRAAEAWIRSRGMTRVLGPANPSMNDPCGMLLEGFKWPPFVLMTYNPPHYPALLEGAGYQKAMDLFAYIILHNELVREKVDQVARSVEAQGEIEIRCADLSRFEDELQLVMQIYNDAWSRNWGFVPMTEEEIRFVAADMKAVLLPEFVYFATHRGETVGFALALPDINHALKRANGRLFPFGWFYFLRRNLRKIPTLRLIALGIKKSHQHLGIGTLFYKRYMDEGLKRGYKAAELSWILEVNELMNRPLRQMGAKPYKTYRIYEKALPSP